MSIVELHADAERLERSITPRLEAEFRWIVAHVCVEFGVPRAELFRRCRRRRLASARFAAWGLARKYTRLTLEDLARLSQPAEARPHHTTVLNGLERFADLQETDVEFRRHIGRIERQLAAEFAPRMALAA